MKAAHLRRIAKKTGRFETISSGLFTEWPKKRKKFVEKRKNLLQCSKQSRIIGYVG
jgi:hypothetical protein